ncbi:DNA excision repair protein ERCC-8 [Marchantia polymorpha subsp. ruderalis]|uniref:Anaphase-promoting complex subunit 4 WD40 domain-containing protein n=2 Tax=Marchantia polymorpha TaxID=3197 RepID=A0AAF6AM69_MARPO|nr:hypothetical protein MARPO_0043s0035 [Marchantia polymorpha]BBM97539.1 hypothetical protein Mp_1g06430 [Marchantia polymorpha subsp. ruderalis]|eukprot:PTQ39778.1 hypothetical protein MARPO_0043s0035 [Marchantia polymorpha]
MWRDLNARELGAIRPGLVITNVSSRRLHSLELSTQKEIVSDYDGGINNLQVDRTEGRYLLAGSSDGSVGCYDTLHRTSVESHSRSHIHDAIFKVDRRNPRGHKYAVSSVQWYPVDTGLFVTGSFDHHVNVWDTNNLQAELQFDMPGKVHSVSMSQVATSHMLIAVGSEDPMVRLCDIATGACTHTLVGHRDAVLAVQWSISCEWTLYTGSCDGAIRFWDIRRAGSHKVLDQHNSQMGRRHPVLKSTPDRVRPIPRDAAKESPTKLLKPASGDKSTKTSSSHGKSIAKKVATAKRLHPGMASVENRATAHYGAVTSLTPTNDGQFLVSAGADSRVKLWDVDSGCNTLVNYENTRMQRSKATQLAVSPDSSLLFVPTSTVIRVYNLWTGRVLKTLRGHYDTVNCCEFHPYAQEMYSGSNDRKILLWSPPPPVEVDEDEKEGKDGGASEKGAFKARPDEDAWSD